MLVEHSEARFTGSRKGVSVSSGGYAHAKGIDCQDVAIHAEVTSVHVCALVAVQLACGGYEGEQVALQEG